MPIGSHHSAAAGTDVWLTPPAILAALGGAESFDLDPCAPLDRPWDMARQHYTMADNGLARSYTAACGSTRHPASPHYESIASYSLCR
ncbi:hypothetical protein [Mesorhizobium sp. M7A.F.Ca.MR.245.00.0.0]|nr:hypothetical protein [Mesorhizobium sp. M7A.F.Ca.MR.245.00.0.0]